MFGNRLQRLASYSRHPPSSFSSSQGGDMKSNESDTPHSYNIPLGIAARPVPRFAPRRRIGVDVQRAWCYTALFCCWEMLFLLLVAFAIIFQMNLNHIWDLRESQEKYFRDVCKKPEMVAKYQDYDRCHELRHVLDQNPRAAAFMQTGVAGLGLCKVVDCAAIGSKINFVLFVVFLIMLAFSYLVLRYGKFVHSDRRLDIPEYASSHQRQD